MTPYSHRFPGYALAAFFLLIAAYAAFEARGLLSNPQITIATSIVETDEPYVRIQGEATRIEELLMDGRAVAVTEEGAFDEPYLLAPGGNRIVFEAKDKYGRRTRRTIDIIYAPPPGQALAASSTPPAQTATSTRMHASTTRASASASPASSTPPDTPPDAVAPRR